jgi:predicted ATP-dependent endonuclease of OLD family
MKKLIRKISGASEKQIFITTHSNLISTRLDLRKSILLNNNCLDSILLKGIDAQTAKFFIKAPDNNLLEFVMSKKVILVEGDAEFILLETFFNKITGLSPEEADVHILSVDGTSFKRYLEVAKALKIKTAVIRDNDGNYENNCVLNFIDYSSYDFIKVFYDKDNSNRTFEICIYETNKSICDELFLAGRRTLSVLDYMIQEKTEVAFQMLEKKSSELVVPDYIKQAILWIKE